MKFTTQKQDILPAISRVKPASDERTTVPILGNTLIDADDNYLFMTATDTRTIATATCSANVDQNGSITVNTQKLFDIIRNMNEGDISIELKDSYFIIKQKRSRFKLPTLPASEYPQRATADGMQFSLNAVDLLDAMSVTSHAMSTEESRACLCGINVKANGNTMSFAATDGHRLSTSAINSDTGEFDIIVPEKTVKDVCKLIDGSAKDIDVTVSNNMIKFDFSGYSLASNLIDGNYPEYERIIPQSNKTELTVNRLIFIKSLNRVLNITKDKSKAVQLSVDGNLMEIKGNGNSGEEAIDGIECASSHDFSVRFNGSYLVDALNAVSVDDVTLLLNTDGQNPCLIEDGNAKIVIMPMKG